MPVIKVSVPHQLGVKEAKSRIAKTIAEMKTQFAGNVSNVEEFWIENRAELRFKAMGFSVSGNLNVEPQVIHVEINLPFAALPFKSKIENDLAVRAKALLT